MEGGFKMDERELENLLEKEENSKKFIGDILGGLNESLSVNFGFIYGYHNKDKTVFYVIDGQQRLTILYLLQQYLYWKGSEQKSLFTLAGQS